MSIFDIAKRAAEVIGATAVIYGAVVAIIIGFGGHVPPWTTIAKAQELEQAIDRLDKQQAVVNRQTQSNIDLLVLDRLRDEARAATEKAEKNPRDSDAQSDKWFAQKKLDIFFKAHPSLAEAMH